MQFAGWAGGGLVWAVVPPAGLASTQHQLPASLDGPLQRAPRLHWEQRLEKRIRLILACGAAATSSDRDTADLVVTDIKKGADI